jgi:small subunit ribosomal protein S20
MPNTLSAKKRLRQTEVRAARNKVLRSSMRTWEKKILQAVEAGDKATAEAELPMAYRYIDKAARKRILHPNTAANHKSRLARKVRGIG